MLKMSIFIAVLGKKMSEWISSSTNWNIYGQIICTQFPFDGTIVGYLLYVRNIWFHLKWMPISFHCHFNFTVSLELFKWMWEMFQAFMERRSRALNTPTLDDSRPQYGLN